MSNVLLLNADFTPIGVISVQRAIVLVIDEKVRMVQEYVGQVLRSPSVVFPKPAVVALRRYVNVGQRIRFNRKNVLARDRFTCQYCGTRPRTRTGHPRLSELNLDHVVARSRATNGRVRLKSGQWVPVTSWENVVCSCVSCNTKKGALSPAQAGLTLLSVPRPPTRWESLRLLFDRVTIPDEWSDFVPEAWRGYWDDELE